MSFPTRSRGRTRSVSPNVTPVQEVTENVKELSIDSACSGGTDKMDMILPALHTRPAHIVEKTGSSGRKIQCLTNFIPLNDFPDWKMYQYHVSFRPEVDSKRFRIKMVNDHRDVFGKNPVFDGMILYMPHVIDDGHLELFSIHPRTNEKVKLLLKITNEVTASEPQCLTVFNLCNRKSFEYLGYRQLGRHYYNPGNPAYVEQHRIEIWPGIISAIRPHEEKLLMCCEMSHKLLRIDDVATFLLELFERYRDQFREKAVQILVGSSVLTRYNNKTYRVDDILWDKHPSDKFTLADGTEMSYIEYYAKQYNKSITHFSQPLLLSRSKSRGGQDVFLIPELCSMTGLTDEMRNDRRVMQDIAQYTRVSPEIRVNYARTYLKNIRKNVDASKLYKSWGLEIGEDLLSVTGRILPRETLLFGKNRRVTYDEKSADWSRECRSMPLCDVVSLNRWLLVFNDRDATPAELFFKNMKILGQGIEMHIADPILVRVRGGAVNDYLEAVKDCLTRENDVEMVVAMVPNDNKTRYDAIKKTLCLDNPIPNQVVRCQSLAKNTTSVCSKILLQMNCKLGGSLWRLDIPMSKVMVIGYDAYYDSANKGKTVGAAVFSKDPSLTKWYSRCALYGDSKQSVANLTEFCRMGLQKYRETTGFLPDKIFLYRDGVGDGQIPVVYNEELPRIQKSFEEIHSNYQPKLAFIIVTKRVTTRYFEQIGNTFGNPPPGTVVDNGVTKPERYDFYLVPQCVRQGTVTPVSYNVIFDETNLPPDRMQRLSYKMCHLYYNWQGTVRVPAPCMYAHKLAFLVGQSLHKPPDETLADKLFFL